MSGRTFRFGIVLASLSLALSACSDDARVPTEPEQASLLDLAFVGTDSCAYCHGEIAASFRKSGHPYKLNKVVDGSPPIYPFSSVPTPPAGYTWDDITYVLGGYGWKARFIGQDGYIITEGGKNQYNLATGEWSDYHADELKPYDCGGCHNTGWSTEGQEDDLAGMAGTFAFAGVQCEECHGKGSLHVLSPRSVPMTIDTRTEACGRCHNRGGMNADIPSSGGYIRHHEQYNEMAASEHDGLSCVTCHDPHTTVKHADEAGVPPVRRTCEFCHEAATASMASSPLADEHAGVDCVSCHMPKIVKSAVAEAPFVADIRSHLMTINMDSEASQFTEEGSLANPYVTLDFACLSCHTGYTREWASDQAALVHGVASQ